MTPEEITYFTNALGHEPSDLEQKLYLRLQLFLNRQPTPNECGNMSTDANLHAWVQAGI